MTGHSKGGKPVLTPEQAAEVASRYRLGRQHSVKAIAAEFGINVSTMRKYAQGFRPKKWSKKA